MIFEDYYFLKKAKYEGYTIVISNKICYFINLKSKYIKSMNKRIKKINYYNDKSMKLSEECFITPKKELKKELKFNIQQKKIASRGVQTFKTQSEPIKPVLHDAAELEIYFSLFISTM